MESAENIKEPLPLVYLSYVRSILGLPLGGLWTLIYGSLAIVVLSFFPSNRIRNYIFHTWGKVSVGFFGLNIEFRGKENFPKVSEPGAVCLFNHTSNFDIPIVNSAIDGAIRWGAKIELFKIPIFGPTLKSMGVLPIARTNREEVLKVYTETIPRLKRGECFFLAPEGTRKDGSQIYPFKSGPFIFAIEAQSPVVPVLIHGAWRVQPKGQRFPCWGRWNNHIVVEVLPPIPTMGLTQDDRPTLQEQAFQVMTKAFHRLNKEHGV